MAGIEQIGGRALQARTPKSPSHCSSRLKLGGNSARSAASVPAGV